MLRQFSNRYHFTNDAPTTAGRWLTFSDAVTAAEKLIYPAPVNGGATIIATYGYAAGSEIPVYTKTYALDGTLTPASGVNAPGDCAAMIRFSTADRSTKNHPIYAFNYFHAAMVKNTAALADEVMANQKTALTTYAAAWVTGFSDGTVTHIRATPAGHVCTGSSVPSLITHRDLPHA